MSYLFSNLDIIKAPSSFHEQIYKVSLDLHPIPLITAKSQMPVFQSLSRDWNACPASSASHPLFPPQRLHCSVIPCSIHISSPSHLTQSFPLIFKHVLILFIDFFFVPQLLYPFFFSNTAHLKTKQNPQLLPATSHCWITEFGCPILTENTTSWNCAILDTLSCSLDCTDLHSELYTVNWVLSLFLKLYEICYSWIINT